MCKEIKPTVSCTTTHVQHRYIESFSVWICLASGYEMMVYRGMHDLCI